MHSNPGGSTDSPEWTACDMCGVVPPVKTRELWLLMEDKLKSRDDLSVEQVCGGPRNQTL